MIGDILQPTHLIFILVVALLVLGPKRLPEVGRSLGKGIRDFRGAMSGIDEAVNPSDTSQQAPATSSVISAGESADTASVQPAFTSAEPPTQVVEPEVATAPAFAESTSSVAPSAAPAFAATHPTAPAMEFDMSSAFPSGTAGSAGKALASHSDAGPTTAVPHAGIHDPDPAEYAD
jgi:sec-independent protein translocase protein TatA